jgi:hypothetical protein
MLPDAFISYLPAIPRREQIHTYRNFTVASLSLLHSKRFSSSTFAEVMTMKIAVVVAILMLSSATFSQQWKAIGPPGGVVSAISLDPQKTNTVFAVTSGEDSLLFKSIDGGVTSKVIEDTSGPVHVSEKPLINPRNPDTLYAGTLRSIDGGETWHSIGVVVAAVNVREPRHLLRTRYGEQLLGSSDGGDEWSLTLCARNATATFWGCSRLQPVCTYSFLMSKQRDYERRQEDEHLGSSTE